MGPTCRGTWSSRSEARPDRRGVRRRPRDGGGAGVRRDPAVLGRGGARPVERRAQRAGRARPHADRPAGDAPAPGRLPALPPRLREAAAQPVRRDPGAAAARPRRRPDPRALPQPGLRRAALDALPRRALQAVVGRRVPAAVLGPRRQRQARRELHLPPDRDRRVARRVAVPRPRARHGRLDLRRDVRRAVDPRAPRARARRRERRRLRPARRAAADRRPRVRGQHAGLPFARRRPRPVGRPRVRRRAPHLPRARTPVDRARDAGRHQDGRSGGELPGALARARPRHVALPLPRRGPHDERDDRPVPGAPMTGAAIAGMAAAMAMRGGGAPGPTVAVPGRFYAPQQLNVLAGQTVTWRNDDTSDHTVTSPDAGFDSGRIGHGGTFSFTFDQPGVYEYACTIHRYMKGTVEVDTLGLETPAPVVAGAMAMFHGAAPPGPGAVTLLRLAPAGAAQG